MGKWLDKAKKTAQAKAEGVARGIAGKVVKPVLHTSVQTLTIGAFRRVLKSGNFDELVISGWPSEEMKADAWRSVYDSYISEFGVPENYRSYLQEMLRAVQRYRGAYVDGHKHMATIAMIHEQRAKGMLGMTDSDDKFSETVAAVSKFMGFRVDPEGTTVLEYGGYLRRMQKEMKDG